MLGTTSGSIIGSISGQLYVDKMDESKMSSGKCVLVCRAWYSPSEVEALGGKKAKTGGNLCNI
jgi:hypothetical protein